MSAFDSSSIISDVLTQELASVRLFLRSDLQITLLSFHRQPWYLVEDPVRGKFFRIGAVEFTFLSQLNGCMLAEAIANTASLCGESAFSEDEAALLCRWLVEANLLETDASHSYERLLESHQQKSLLARRAWLNPIMLKIPLFDPSRIVRQLEQVMGWIISLPALAVWSIVCCSSALVLASQWTRFRVEVSHVIDPNNWTWMCLTWIVLKLLHEMAHALACQRFGGRVREAGVLFLLFIPMPYVDVSSSWRFPDKSQRMVTAAAGMLAEFFVAAIAVMVWANSSSAIVQQHAVNVIVSSTLVTLLFNSNPLMRFDGYYILTDWLELPNLSTRAKTMLRGWLRWVFFGLPVKAAAKDNYQLFIGFYAVASAFWMMTVVLSISIGAANLLPGIGLLLAVLSVGLCVVPATLSFIKFFLWGNTYEQPRRVWFAITAFSLAVIVWGMGELLPAPQALAAPIIVEPAHLETIRNRVAGLVVNVLVKEGDVVQAGDVLVELENPELIAQAQSLVLSLKQSEIRLRQQLIKQETATAQIESENLSALRVRQQELAVLIAALSIRAEATGVVISTKLNELQGAYLHPGTLVMELSGRTPPITNGLPSDSFEMQVTAMISPKDLELDSSAQQDFFKKPVSIRVWGDSHGAITGWVKQISPNASTELKHPAWGANLGGPLAVRPVAESDHQPQGQWRLLDPMVGVEIQLTDRTQRLFRAGQMGIAKFRVDRGPLRRYLLNRAWDWWENRFLPQHGI